MQFKEGYPKPLTYAEKRRLVKTIRRLQKMNTGYFEFQQLNSAGYPIGELVRVNTVTGITLQIHPLCDTKQVTHICGMAQDNPNYPYDLSAFRGESLEWSARITYRSNKDGYETR